MDDRFAVLVVDDDQDIREILSEVIAAEGFPVVCASDGREALDLLLSGFRPGLVILDLMMPVMNGWEMLRALRANAALATLPVAVVSASGEKNAPKGATGYLRKPVDLDEVLAMVRMFCGQAEAPTSEPRTSGFRVVRRSDAPPSEDLAQS